jgi:hypothetical protein
MWTWSGNGGLAGPFDHASNSHPAEWLAALIDEDVGAFRSSSLLLPLQELETVHLVAFQVVDAISAALEPMMVRFGRSMSSQGKYEAAFRENDIDETVLPSLTHETLKELGVTAVGHRLKLIDAIAALRSDASGKTLSVDAATTSSAPSAHPVDRTERRQVTVMFSDMVFSRNAASYFPRPRLRSQSTMSMIVTPPGFSLQHIILGAAQRGRGAASGFGESAREPEPATGGARPAVLACRTQTRELWQDWTVLQGAAG